MLLKTKKLVLCITNNVSINQVANTIISAGASPIMTNEAEDAKELVGIASAIYINIGTIDANQMAVIKAVLTANKKRHIPIVLDPVGAGSSEIRYWTTLSILESKQVTIIRGNSSEIKGIIEYRKNKTGMGVDAIQEDYDTELARKVSEKYKCTVLMTGEKDIVFDSTVFKEIDGGQNHLGSLTGIGCMLSGLTAALVTIKKPIEAAFYASSAFKDISLALFEAQKRATYDSIYDLLVEYDSI